MGRIEGAMLMFRTNRRRRIKNRMRLLPARYLSTGAIFDQVRSNNRTSPINRTRNLLAGPIRRFFKISYVEIIQFITLIALWAVAARIYPLGFWEFSFPPLLIVGYVGVCFYIYDLADSLLFVSLTQSTMYGMS